MGSNGRQFVKYNFFKVDPAWRRLPDEERADNKREFAAVVEELDDLLMTRSYSLMGLRGDADFMLWHASATLESLQQTATQLFGTGLGKYLAQPYSYLAMTRKSEYVGTHRHAEQEGLRTKVTPSDSAILIVYPFVKTRDWYLLPQAERQRMMAEHFRVGHKYPSVQIHTTYSFGLDDQEFMLGFETDTAADFLDLVMELRTIEASRYTVEDTPIFTCLARPLDQTLDSLGG